MAADIRNPYYAALFVACEKAAREAGYTAVLCNFLEDREAEKNLLVSLQEQKVDAIIQFGGRVDDLASKEEYVELVNQIMARTPVVVTGKLDGTRCHAVRLSPAHAAEWRHGYSGFHRHLTGWRQAGQLQNEREERTRASYSWRACFLWDRMLLTGSCRHLRRS